MNVRNLFCSVPSARDEPPEPSDPEAAKHLLCVSCSGGLEGKTTSHCPVLHNITCQPFVLKCKTETVSHWNKKRQWKVLYDVFKVAISRNHFL